MSYSPEDSRIKLTAEQTAKVATMRPDEMKEFFRDVAVAQGLVTRDLDPHLLVEVENPPAQPTRFAKRVLVDGGQTKIFEGNSELELERAIGDYFRSLEASKEEESATAQRTAAATPTAEEIAAKVELELKFKRGEITTEQYLNESGAVGNYLREQGIDLESLRSTTDQHFEQSWADATDEFLNSPEGSAWPGGPNLKVMGDLLAANNLESADDKVGALKACFQFMKEHEMVQENPELVRNQRLAEARSSDEVREILGARDATTIFGR
jgi:hypothetical protein